MEEIHLEGASSGLKKNLGCNELTNVSCMSGCRGGRAGEV